MLNLRACEFHQLAVFDAGRAGGFAGAAVKTFVDVIDEGVRDWRGSLPSAGKTALRNVDHLADAPARRIGFEVPKSIGGAGVQAKTAVNAAGVIFVDRRDPRDGSGWHDAVLAEK